MRFDWAERRAMALGNLLSRNPFSPRYPFLRACSLSKGGAVPRHSILGKQGVLIEFTGWPIEMTDTKYYSGKKLSRRKVSSGKYPFPYLSVDFHLKFCILKENPRTRLREEAHIPDTCPSPHFAKISEMKSISKPQWPTETLGI